MIEFLWQAAETYSSSQPVLWGRLSVLRGAAVSDPERVGLVPKHLHRHARCAFQHLTGVDRCRCLGRGGSVRRADRAIHFAFSLDETCDIGSEAGSPVSPDYGARDHAFSGEVSWVQIDGGKEDYDRLISAKGRPNFAMMRRQKALSSQNRTPLQSPIAILVPQRRLQARIAGIWMHPA